MKRDTFELIQALEGSIEPYAETHVDEKHLANLKEWCELHERITDEIAKRIASYGPEYVQVSLEGSKKTNDYIRGKGVYWLNQKFNQ